MAGAVGEVEMGGLRRGGNYRSKRDAPFNRVRISVRMSRV
jgi:hypothetical protein